MEGGGPSESSSTRFLPFHQDFLGARTDPEVNDINDGDFGKGAARREELGSFDAGSAGGAVEVGVLGRNRLKRPI